MFNSEFPLDTSSFHKMFEYLNENIFIIPIRYNELKCVVCDVLCDEENMAIHMSENHHKIMVLNSLSFAKMLKKNDCGKIKLPDNIVTSKLEDLNLDSEISSICETQDDNKNNSNVETKNKVSTGELSEKVQPIADNEAQMTEQPNDININDHKTKPQDIDERFLKHDITVNSHCKHCKKNLDLDNVSLEQHIITCKSKGKEVNQSQKININDYMLENDIVLSNNKPYCKLCCININKNFNDLSEHVSSDSHKTNALSKEKVEPPVINKVLFSKYIQFINHVKTDIESDFVVNYTYALKYNSFFCVTTDLEGFTCTLCKTHIENNIDLVQHLNTNEHKKEMSDCYVLIFIAGEFVRQITSSTYHCGFCNVVLEEWEALQTHLTSPLHREARQHAEWNLQRWQAILRDANKPKKDRRHHFRFILK